MHSEVRGRRTLLSPLTPSRPVDRSPNLPPNSCPRALHSEGQSTKDRSTKDQATKDQATKDQAKNGSTVRTPAFMKSTRFQGATARFWTTAVAAMRLSWIGIAFPAVRRLTCNSAHFNPVSASQGRQRSRPTPPSNQFSSAARLLPTGRMRMPNRSSPTMTGSTALRQLGLRWLQVTGRRLFSSKKVR